jgi:probable ATP-dependent RNA helicase DDX4
LAANFNQILYTLLKKR